MAEKQEKDIPQVGTMDPTKKNSPVADGPVPDENDVKARTLCWFNGAQFAPGAEVCSGGVQLRCRSNGTWYRVGRC